MKVRLDEILPTKEAVRSLPRQLERLASGEVECLVLTTRLKPRGVLLTVERYEALLRGRLEVGPGIEQALRDATAQLAECYRLTGADPDGDSDSMLAKFAVEEVRRLREKFDQLSERTE